MELPANAQRFSGFADLYDRVRPTPPPEAAEVLCAYVGRDRPDVVDLGSGTGLSTRWCADWAAHVVGVEPSDDMRAQAEQEARANVEYVRGWSDDSGLPDGSADVVLAVQALHWMDPAPTFGEVARVLRPGGAFVALDCDWPPVVGNAEAEAAWDHCRAAVRRHEAHVDTEVRRWAKEEHLARMAASGRFAVCREIALHHAEEGDADRFVDLLRSQGDYQTLRRAGIDDATLGLDEFVATVQRTLGRAPRPFWFTYRLRIGITPAAR